MGCRTLEIPSNTKFLLKPLFLFKPRGFQITFDNAKATEACLIITCPRIGLAGRVTHRLLPHCLVNARVMTLVRPFSHLQLSGLVCLRWYVQRKCILTWASCKQGLWVYGSYPRRSDAWFTTQGERGGVKYFIPSFIWVIQWCERTLCACVTGRHHIPLSCLPLPPSMDN